MLEGSLESSQDGVEGGAELTQVIEHLKGDTHWSGVLGVGGGGRGGREGGK